ncbi:MAG: 4,5-DOPA dioxygenase extradiol [Campylobacteraceae bacterium]
MKKMPILFVGHGSPMNILEKNEWTKNWEEIGKKIPTPKSILVISAHWVANKTYVTTSKNLDTIYDFYSFPKELYELSYPAKGDIELANKVSSMFEDKVFFDDKRGLDHGAWCVLYHLFPKANIPVIQLSINSNFTPHESYEFGKKLQSLRDEGVLIIGSGDVVHNLALCNWNMQKRGFDWAITFDEFVEDSIKTRNHENIIHYEKAPEFSGKEFYTREHYEPLLYILGASREDDTVEVFNEGCDLGAVSMTSYMLY